MKVKGRIMYLGQWLNSENSVRHQYITLNGDDSLGRKWYFGTKLFKKGTIGSVYDCSFKDSDTISYNKNTIPTSLLFREGKGVSTFILFPELRKYEEESRQVEIKIRNSKKPTSPLEEEIKFMKSTFKSLPVAKRAAFIGNLIYRITS